MTQLSPDRLLARGRTADVYAWDEEHVLKLFHNWFELEDIEYEQRIGGAVYASGVNAPAVGDLLHVDGRQALIYERVPGESMLGLLQRKPWRVFAYARLLARLQVEMHQCVFKAEVPPSHGKIKYKIEHAQALSEAQKSDLINALARLPEGDRVCHGDFHPANVLISGTQATVIDWIDASRGNPLADVARTSIILLGLSGSKQTSHAWMKAFVGLFHSTYLKHYFHLRPGGEAEHRRWLPIVAGARLSENIPELESWLIRQVTFPG